MNKEKQLVELITEWTRTEIAARFPTFVLPGQSPLKVSSDCWQTKVDKENAIREAVFGTDCLVEIGCKLGMMNKPEEKKKRKRRTKKPKLKVGRRADR